MANGMPTEQARGLSARALTSLSLACAGAWLAPSGIALHFAADSATPTIAHLFMSLHNTAAFVFLVVGAVHVWLNRRAMVQYIRSKLAGVVRLRRELIIAVVGVSGVVWLVAAHGLHGR